MDNPFDHEPASAPPAPRPQPSEPRRLSGAECQAVGGGINPQPLPPFHDPD